MPGGHADDAMYEHSRSREDSLGEGSPDRDLGLVTGQVAQGCDASAQGALRIRDSVQDLFLPGRRQGPGGEVDASSPRIADEVNVGVDEPWDHRQFVPTAAGVLTISVMVSSRHVTRTGPSSEMPSQAGIPSSCTPVESNRRASRVRNLYVGRWRGCVLDRRTPRGRGGGSCGAPLRCLRAARTPPAALDRHFHGRRPRPPALRSGGRLPAAAGLIR